MNARYPEFIEQFAYVPRHVSDGVAIDWFIASPGATVV
jgi:hypothetical protein